MDHPDRETVRMRFFSKRQVVIPIFLRKKCRIEVGDHPDVMQAPEGILLKPVRPHKPPAMSDELFGLFAKYARKKGHLTKKRSDEATEKGFAVG